MMADERKMVEEAYAGDIIGIFDPGIFSIGDTLTTAKDKFQFEGIPTFAPEHFARVRLIDSMKRKQFVKGVTQIAQEGAIQIFQEYKGGMEEIIVGVVGVLQFDVLRFRLENEYNAKCRWEPVSLYKACWIESEDETQLEAFKKRKYQFMAKDREGRDVFLADSNYVLQMAQNDFEHIKFHFTSEF